MLLYHVQQNNVKQYGTATAVGNFIRNLNQNRKE